MEMQKKNDNSQEMRSVHLQMAFSEKKVDIYISYSGNKLEWLEHR